MIEKYVKGDLLKISETVGASGVVWAAHGCNCVKTMGAGIALQIRDKYPMVYYADLLYPNPKLGEYSSITLPSGVAWFNLYTQSIPGPHADIDAIKECFKKLNDLYLNVGPDYKEQFKGLYIPLIGCGIGGLVWKDVEKVINEVTPDLKITVVIYEQ